MVITPNTLNPFDPSTHLPKPHLRPSKTLLSNPPLPPPFPRHAVSASNLRRRQRAKLYAKPTPLRITACKASSSTPTSSNAVGEDAESAFEVCAYPHQMEEYKMSSFSALSPKI